MNVMMLSKEKDASHRDNRLPVIERWWPVFICLHNLWNISLFKYSSRVSISQTSGVCCVLKRPYLRLPKHLQLNGIFPYMNVLVTILVYHNILTHPDSSANIAHLFKTISGSPIRINNLALIFKFDLLMCQFMCIYLSYLLLDSYDMHVFKLKRLFA